MRRIAVALVAGGLVTPHVVSQAEDAHDNLPAAFEQIIPRGRIASIDDPRFVSAAEAELPGDAWILGVKVGAVAKAYSLNLLNRHEIVNDRIGDLPVAAVW